MDISDERTIAAPPNAVYEGLLDPSVLRVCLPGVTRIEGAPASGYAVTVALKFGWRALSFDGRIVVEKAIPSTAMTLAVPGRAKAAITLEPVGAGTHLRYDLALNDKSHLVRLGGPLVRRLAARLSSQFFGRLQDEMTRRTRGEPI